MVISSSLALSSGVTENWKDDVCCAYGAPAATRAVECIYVCCFHILWFLPAQLMGIREDPYEFFIDMFKLALAMQLSTAAVVFYGTELGLGLDAGDAFRAVGGLFLGYFLRLGIKIEHLVGDEGHHIWLTHCDFCATGTIVMHVLTWISMPVAILMLCCTGDSPGLAAMPC